MRFSKHHFAFIFSLLLISILSCHLCRILQAKELEGVTFKDANDYYREGEYEKAIQAYGSLLEKSPDTALAYNLANAYFKAFQASPNESEGYLGMAILYYEKVLRADPRFHDARSNLHYARTLLTDEFSETEEQQGLYGLIAAVYSYSKTWQLELLFAFFLWFLVGLIFLRRWAKREALCELIFWLLFLVIPLTLFIGLWSFNRAWADEVRHEAIILSREVNALASPQTDATQVFTLHEGSKVSIVRRSKGWVQISLPNGFSGWLRKESLASID